mmetsp:Transcript_27001/g.45303  ORF Transcript_27001/g.45303 Transcript_27001/m.45303 type:complete len:665 (-) Transcript_27001:189-2183(-)
MSNLVVEDLVSGLSEWRNIQEIVRMTFNALHDVVKSQGEKIKGLEDTLAREADRNRKLDMHVQDLTAGLRLKASVSDVNKSISEMTRVIDTKADATEVAAHLEKKASKIELKSLRSSLADSGVVQEIERRLQERPNRSELENAIGQVRDDIRTAARSLADVKKSVEGKADRAELDGVAMKTDFQTLQSAVLDTQADEVRVLERALEQKASKSEVNSAVAQVLQEFADTSRLVTELSKELTNKADAATVFSQLDKKASKTDLQSVFKSSIDDINQLVEQHETILESVRSELARKANAKDVAEALETKANVSALQEGLSSRVSKQQVEAALHRKANRADVEASLERKADINDVNNVLMRKADIEQVSTLLNQKASIGDVDERIRLVIADLHKDISVLATKSEMEAKAGQAVRESRTQARQEVESLQILLDTKASAGEVRALKGDLSGLRQALEEVDRKLAEGGPVDVVRREVALKANVQDVLSLLDAKASIEDVNKALEGVNRELETRVRIDEMHQVQNELRASLVHSNMYARWIWKSGKTKGPGGGVPWNIQVVNTAPENFLWEKDKVNLVTIAPGLYEVTFGFYARRKPTVQMLVNGEPVLSAMNSTSYAVHHSSGRLTSIERHPAGNITGLTLIDFLALPPKARLAITYSGDEGEGFFSLRKL